MMSLQSDLEERFLYRGNAFAIGGYMTRPYAETIETEASSILSMVGGSAQASVEDYRYRDLISFRSAHSKVVGNVDIVDGRRVYNTLATVSLEDLNIADLITADRVVARLVSEKPEGEPELPMLPVGSYITNLRIAGQPIRLREQEPIFDAPTLHHLAERGETGLQGITGETLKVPHLPPSHVEGEGRHYEDHRVLTSLYRLPTDLPSGCSTGKTPDGAAIYPWGIHIQGFGTVYFGEMLITRFSRRLNMIRLKMGSPEEGEVILIGTEGNGTTYP